MPVVGPSILSVAHPRLGRVGQVLLLVGQDVLHPVDDTTATDLKEGNRSRPLVVNGDLTHNRTLDLNPLVAVALPRPIHVGASNVAAWGV